MEVSDIEPSSSSAVVHSVVVGEVSPIKTSRKNGKTKYFQGKLTNGKKNRQAVSFDPKLHAQFKEVKNLGCSVALQKCYVKRSRFEMDNVEIC